MSSPLHRPELRYSLLYLPVDACTETCSISALTTLHCVRVGEGQNGLHIFRSHDLFCVMHACVQVQTHSPPPPRLPATFRAVSRCHGCKGPVISKSLGASGNLQAPPPPPPPS